MHFALDRNSQYISAERAYQQFGSKFFCPRCQQTLIIKESKLGRHFLPIVGHAKQESNKN
ncbi:hypothetical protein [Ignavigranum ruoffiae]|uniref:hypothetical protein n=1 Tax=Ignavigranum ruoffiae TaxID=89093 RepID=UPI00235474C5|nr:hypothetical protein [Ignavigranum ruoffiae]